MKLAECLLQEKPIRHESHRDKGIWFVPKIKKYGDKLHLSSHDLYNLHTLSAEDFACDDHDLVMEKQWVLDQMQARIKQKENELAEEKSKFENFKNMFGKYFENGTPDASKIG